MTKSSIRAGLATAFCLLLMACSDDKADGDKPDATQGGTGAAGAGPDAGPSQASASAFCDAYETRCGFGRENTFSDREDCEDDFADKFNQARKQCAAEHLEKAAGDPGAYCEAAKGDAVCRAP